MNRILITGAAGKIGSTLREGLRGRYRVLRLTDIAPLGPARAGEEIVRADLADLAAVEAAMQGVDCVVHLGAIPGEDTWDKILPNNVVGTWNVFEAARRQGVRRVVYASSHHAVGFYRRDRDIDQTVVPRPDGIYGVSKVFGEAVGRLFADKHGLSVACLRIGAFRDKPDGSAPAPCLAQPARRRATGRMLHRCARLSFHHRVRRLRQRAQPLPQCRPRVPRLSAAGQSGGLCGRHPAHARTPRTRSRGNSTAACIRRWGSTATSRGSSSGPLAGGACRSRLPATRPGPTLPAGPEGGPNA